MIPNSKLKVTDDFLSEIKVNLCMCVSLAMAKINTRALPLIMFEEQNKK